MVRIDGVTIAIGGRTIVHDVTARLDGGVIGLIGPNGAGKSTLVRAIAGLAPIARGTIRIGSGGRDAGTIGNNTAVDGATGTHAVGDDAQGAVSVGAMTPRPRARAIAYLPQGQAVHWPLTVARLVALGRLPHLAPYARPGAADADAIERALARTDMIALRDRPIDQLSGGERARALIARALAVEAPLLLADEPLAALDPAHQIAVMRLLRAEADRGATVIAVLHDLTLAARHCDRLLLLAEGRLVADGAPAAVLTAARLAEVYGVTAWIGAAAGGPMVVPIDRAGAPL